LQPRKINVHLSRPVFACNSLIILVLVVVLLLVILLLLVVVLRPRLSIEAVFQDGGGVNGESR
jgi:hypothetical protein